jgi:hypothetical protein
MKYIYYSFVLDYTTVNLDERINYNLFITQQVVNNGFKVDATNYTKVKTSSTESCQKSELEGWF